MVAQEQCKENVSCLVNFPERSQLKWLSCEKLLTLDEKRCESRKSDLKNYSESREIILNQRKLLNQMKKVLCLE